MDTVQLAKVLKALSHPNRLELFLEIARQNEASFESGGECFITDIIGSLNIGAPTISHHLKELANAGLVTTRRRGKYLVAKVNKETFERVKRLLAMGED
ncbi:MAG TPA: metalloregulator ArsR/SmtB family transcription factor [Syntrophobacteraceae bacterium]|nr:metalloregulator ArsR/SmtB family transcription factor [Syntrophobacteraceae bacterium]